MSAAEIRVDQLTGLRTILASQRAERPGALSVAEVPGDPADEADCPFCEGHEDRTPPELWAARSGGSAPDSPGWEQRSVPNPYPVLVQAQSQPSQAESPRGELGLSSAADPLLASARTASPDLFGSSPASGSHEVIVNCPRHVVGLGELSGEEMAGALSAWRQRVAAHAEAASYVQLIVNAGSEAGASVAHTHAQLYALPFVPARVARERERFSSYHERTAGGQLLSDIAVEEIRRGERLVAVDEEAILLCPWASPSPYTMWLLPRTPEPRFDRDERGAALLARALGALAGALGCVPQVNLWVRTAPRATEQFHWRIEIAPRVGIKAGFELSTGVEVNTLAPEAAAERLRAAL